MSSGKLHGQDLGFKIWVWWRCLGFRVWGLGFGGSGFRVEGPGNTWRVMGT